MQVGDLVPIPLDLVEMGLPEGLEAKVLSVDECPQIADGPGQVVLTTVNHLNRDLWEITLVDGDEVSETIRPTGFHKFYSATRSDWVSASSLEVGEEVASATGSPMRVSALHHVPGVHRVYNMTVEGEHVYYVSRLGALVHNNKCLPDGTPDPAATRPKLRKATKEEARASAPKTPDGDYIDPNNGKILPQDGPFDYGHPPGQEWWRLRDQARAEGWTRQQVIEAENAKKFQIEDRSSNRAHTYEEPK